MAKDKLEELNEYFDTLLEKKAEEIAEAEEIIKRATAEREEAMKDRTTAFDNQDTKTYHKAADSMRTATDTIDMYTKKLNNLNNTGVIDKGTYEEYLAVIKADQITYLNSVIDKVCSSIDELAPLKDEVHDRIIRGNQLIERLQLKVYRDPHYYSEVARGCSYPGMIEKCFDNTGITHMLDHLTTFKAYKDYKQRNV